MSRSIFTSGEIKRIQTGELKDGIQIEVITSASKEVPLRDIYNHTVRYLYDECQRFSKKEGKK
jgi:hypothetical protein